MLTENIQKMKEAHQVLVEFPFAIKQIEKGYADRFLRIDLDNNKIEILPVSQQMKDLWTGGKGFDLWLLFQEINKDTKWDSPNNPICFSSGPLGGTTSFPGSGKTLVTSISPITQSIMDCNVGGFFGPYFKFAGFDAMVIVGKAKEESIIVIDAVKKNITIEKAPQESIDSHVAAEELTAMYADDELDKRNISVVSSGSAAIHTRMGILNFSFWDWRRNVTRIKQAGRGGIGTVFRDKKLKALVVKNRHITPAWRISESKAAKETAPGTLSKSCGQDLSRIDSIIDKWGKQPEFVFEMMCDIQDSFHCISKTAIDRLQARTSVPKAYLYHMATFYPEFSLVEKKDSPTTGKNVPAAVDIFTCGQPVIFRSLSPAAPGTISGGMYAAFKKVIAHHQDEPGAVIEEIKKSGLRGLGGAGYPTGLKWQAAVTAAKEKNEPLYIVCNAAGTLISKTIIENNPHALIEGMLTGAFATRAQAGFIYLRKEYTTAAQALETAIAAARQAGFLGTNIQGTGFAFDITQRRGPADFLAGESSALLQAMSGRAGEAQPRYIHSTESGFRGHPTILDNVETWVNIPVIIDKGAQWYSSGGTKVFALSGAVSKPGLVEAPLGTPLQDLIAACGGAAPGRTIKAVQVGGPSGGIIPANQLHIAAGFDSLEAAGAMIGSAEITVLDNEACLIDYARQQMAYLAGQSCGKCTPCREGLVAMARTLDRVCEGQGSSGDIEFLEETAEMVKDMSLCRLGGTAPQPVLSTLRHFKDEYEQHIARQSKCCGKKNSSREVK